MTDEEMAEEYAWKSLGYNIEEYAQKSLSYEDEIRLEDLANGFLAGLKSDRQ